MTLTIAYDNNAYDPALQTAWGFACLVETEAGTVLFDTGGEGPTLYGNMARLGLDVQAIDAVVLSHAHADHTGGLQSLLDLGVRPTVYVPAAFETAFKDSVRARTELVEVTGPVEILPGVLSTGMVDSGIVEQALAVETGEGLVVVTGCAHPGVVDMVRRAREAATGAVTLVVGGFHLERASRRQVSGIVAEFRRLGVERVAPCHCTGDRARQMLADAFGEDCFLPGVGWRIVVGAGEEKQSETDRESRGRHALPGGGRGTRRGSGRRAGRWRLGHRAERAPVARGGDRCLRARVCGQLLPVA